MGGNLGCDMQTTRSYFFTTDAARPFDYRVYSYFTHLTSGAGTRVV